MDAEATVREYYGALRRGDPLSPYFVERPDVVKVGIGDRLVGYDAVAEGLCEQTRTTGEWTVESRELRARERGDCAWFADLVGLAWTDRERDARLSFESRWSGTLERQGGEWLFVGMHVSAPVRADEDGSAYAADESGAV